MGTWKEFVSVIKNWGPWMGFLIDELKKSFGVTLRVFLVIASSFIGGRVLYLWFYGDAPVTLSLILSDREIVTAALGLGFVLCPVLGWFFIIIPTLVENRTSFKFDPIIKGYKKKIASLERKLASKKLPVRRIQDSSTL